MKRQPHFEQSHILIPSGQRFWVLLAVIARSETDTLEVAVGIPASPSCSEQPLTSIWGGALHLVEVAGRQHGLLSREL